LKKYEDIESLRKINDEGLYSFAIDLVDIEESLKELINQISVLKSEESSKDEIEDTLFDIAGEFNHILYHIKTSVYYSYLDSLY